VCAALRRFQRGPHAQRKMVAPGFAGEAERLRELGVPDDALNQVRYLGYPTPFKADVPLPARYVSITQSDGRLDIWPGLSLEDGCFAEDDWPHIPLRDDISNEDFGRAMIEAIQR
jgi:hypothetical protein